MTFTVLMIGVRRVAVKAFRLRWLCAGDGRYCYGPTPYGEWTGPGTVWSVWCGRRVSLSLSEALTQFYTLWV